MRRRDEEKISQLLFGEPDTFPPEELVMILPFHLRLGRPE